MRVIILIILIFFNLAKTEAKELKICISQTISHPALDNTLQGVIDTLKEEYGNNVNIIVKNAQGNALLANQIAKNFLSLEPDLMIGIGTLSSQSLVRTTKNIPIIFSSVTDPISAGIIDAKNISSGVSNYINPDIQFAKIKEFGFSIVGCIFNPGEINSTKLIEQMQHSSKKYNIKLISAPAINTREVSTAALNLLSKNVDVIFINNDNTALSAFSSIVKIARKNKVAVISSDLENLNQGAFLAIGPNQYKIGVETAKLAIKRLYGINSNERIIYSDDVEVKFGN